MSSTQNGSSSSVSIEISARKLWKLLTPFQFAPTVHLLSSTMWGRLLAVPEVSQKISTSQHELVEIRSHDVNIKILHNEVSFPWIKMLIYSRSPRNRVKIYWDVSEEAHKRAEELASNSEGDSDDDSEKKSDDDEEYVADNGDGEYSSDDEGHVKTSTSRSRKANKKPPKTSTQKSAKKTQTVPRKRQGSHDNRRTTAKDCLTPKVAKKQSTLRELENTRESSRRVINSGPSRRRVSPQGEQAPVAGRDELPVQNDQATTNEPLCNDTRLSPNDSMNGIARISVEDEEEENHDDGYHRPNVQRVKNEPLSPLSQRFVDFSTRGYQINQSVEQEDPVDTDENINDDFMDPFLQPTSYSRVLYPGCFDGDPKLGMVVQKVVAGVVFVKKEITSDSDYYGQNKNGSTNQTSCSSSQGDLNGTHMGTEPLYVTPNAPGAHEKRHSGTAMTTTDSSQIVTHTSQNDVVQDGNAKNSSNIAEEQENGSGNSELPVSIQHSLDATPVEESTTSQSNAEMPQSQTSRNNTSTREEAGIDCARSGTISLADHERIVAEIKEQYEKEKRRVTKYRAKCSAKSETIAEQQTELEARTMKISKLKGKIECHEEHSRNQEREHREFSRECESLRLQDALKLEEKQRTIGTLEETIQQLEEENEKLRAQLRSRDAVITLD